MLEGDLLISPRATTNTEITRFQPPQIDGSPRRLAVVTSGNRKIAAGLYAFLTKEFKFYFLIISLTDFFCKGAQCQFAANTKNVDTVPVDQSIMD